MIKKIGTEVKIKDEILNIKIGTTDKKNPSVIYLDINCFLSPIYDKKTYKDEYTAMYKKINDFSIHLINNMLICGEKHGFNNNYILNFEFPYERVGLGKLTYLSFQIYFKQNYNRDFKTLLSSMKDYLFENNEVINGIINDCDFRISKKKK